MKECNAWLRSGIRNAVYALVVMSLSFAAVPYAAASKDSVPDWVRTAAAQTIPAYPPETNAVVLLDDTTYTVTNDGKAIEHCRRVVKILRPAGRDEGIVQVFFDNDTKILGLHVWSIGPDGHEYALNDKEFTEDGYPGSGNLYEDYKVKVGRAPGRDPGGVVAYEYDQRVRPYVTEYDWFLQENIPRLNQTFTLELPPGYTYQTGWARHDAVPAADLEHDRWRWEMKDTPAINLNHVMMHPASLALTGRMTIHYGGPGINLATQGSWQGIGLWYEQLAKDRLASTPEIAAKAKELAGDRTDFYDKTEVIAEFVQKQVRYFVIEMGVGGYQPHYAADIFHNRYGDCKDKATLLSAMLSSVGIHSALMMVDHRRGVIVPDAPSLVGDHMIAAIEVPKGYDSPKLRSVVTAKTGRRYLIFDPTWDKTPFGQLEHELQGGYGVLMEGPESQVIALPILSPDLNTIRRTASFQLQPDGSLKGSVTEKRFGDVSDVRREMYTSGDARQQSDFIDHLLEQDFTSFKVTDLKVANVEALNKDFTTTYSIVADRFGKNLGSLLMVRPRVLGTENLRPDHERRTVPIDLKQTLLEKDDYDIELPSGYAVDETPDPVKIDLGFASYESSTQVKNNVLHYSRTYTVREVTLPAEKYADLQKLAGVIAADEQSTAVLKKQ